MLKIIEQHLHYLFTKKTYYINTKSSFVIISLLFNFLYVAWTRKREEVWSDIFVHESAKHFLSFIYNTKCVKKWGKQSIVSSPIVNFVVDIKSTRKFLDKKATDITHCAKTWTSVYEIGNKQEIFFNLKRILKWRVYFMVFDFVDLFHVFANACFRVDFKIVYLLIL